MKSIFFISFIGSSALSALLFSGCGGGDTALTKQPHDTSKLGRSVSIKKDWTWDVGANTVLNRGGDITIYTDFWAGLPDTVKNYQYFIDIDKNENTGYSGANGWEINGADYLIENGDIYQSMSHTEWKWKYIGTFQTSLLDNKKGLAEDETLLMRNPTIPLKLEKIFNTDSFNVMIEVYDKNWEGDFNTVTDIVVNVDNRGNPPSDGKITKENARKILQTRYQQDTVRNIYSLKKLTDDKYLVKYRLSTVDKHVNNAYIYAIVDFKAESSYVVTAKNFNDWDEDPIEEIDTNAQTVTYTKEKTFPDWDYIYQGYFTNTEHIKINFNTYKTVDSYVTQEASGELKSKIRQKSMVNFRGLPQKIYGYGKDAYVISTRTKYRYGHLEVMRFFTHYDVTHLNDVIIVEPMPEVDYDNAVDPDSLKIKSGTDKDEIFLEYTIPSKKITVHYNLINGNATISNNS